MIFSVLLIGFLFVVIGFFIWIEIYDHWSERHNCPACQTGSVLFTDRDDTLCYPHYRRRQHIELLEWKMDRLDELG